MGPETISSFRLQIMIYLSISFDILKNEKGSTKMPKNIPQNKQHKETGFQKVCVQLQTGF